jgi:hypothetical protein
MKVPALTLRLSSSRRPVDDRIFIGFCTSCLASFTSIPSRAAIKTLDCVLRSFLGIREFTQDPRCVLRFSRAYSRSEVILPNGESVREGDPILELHFWNDRLGMEFHHDRSRTALRSALRNSMALLAYQLRTDRHMGDIRAVHGVLARGSSRSHSISHPFGCTVYVEQRPPTRGIRDFFEDLLIHLLHWAFNPRGRAARSFRLCRADVWISARDLKERFGGSASSSRPDSIVAIAALSGAQSTSACEMEAMKAAGD